MGNITHLFCNAPARAPAPAILIQIVRQRTGQAKVKVTPAWKFLLVHHDGQVPSPTAALLCWSEQIAAPPVGFLPGTLPQKPGEVT